jgi:hypothetical protein
LFVVCCLCCLFDSFLLGGIKAIDDETFFEMLV